MDKQTTGNPNNGQIFKGELKDDQAVVGGGPDVPAAPHGKTVPIGSTKDVNAHEHRQTDTPIYKEEH